MCLNVMQRPVWRSDLHSRLVYEDDDKKRSSPEHEKLFSMYRNEKVVNNNGYLSPVADSTMYQLISSLAAQQDWHVRHYTIQNSFSNGRLENHSYEELPNTWYETDIGKQTF